MADHEDHESPAAEKQAAVAPRTYRQQRNDKGLSSLAAIAVDMTIPKMQLALQQLARQAAAAQPSDRSTSCPECADGWLYKRAPRGVRHAVRCACWLRTRHMAGVPAHFQSTRLQDLESDAGNARAMAEAARFVADKATDLCIIGPPGTGKTAIGSACGNERFWVGDANAHFIRLGFLIDEQLRAINDAQYRASAHRLLERVRHADPLILDDVGAGEKGSDHSRRVLQNLMDRRTDLGLKTLYTSNLAIPELEKLYDRRIISRLFEGSGVVIEIEGRDRRIKRAASVLPIRGAKGR